MKADDLLTTVKGVGEAVAKKFKTLGIVTIEDLLKHYPRRYEDYSNVQNIRDIKPGNVTIKVTIKTVNGRYVRGGLHITEAVASDETGSIKIVWFNQPYRATAIQKNALYYISGLFEFRKGRLGITNPSMELVSNFPTNTARIVPIYRETKNLNSSQIRKVLTYVFQSKSNLELPDILPSWIIKNYKLMHRMDAIYCTHFPNNQNDIAKARWSLGFEELFELILASLLNKEAIVHEQALKVSFDEKLAKQFVAQLPFQLTNAQRKVVWQIYQDLQKNVPMNRLVEGDVGSGKTVVATMAAIMVMQAGFQVAFMAPTELLARQHAETLSNLLKPLDMSKKVALLVGKMTTKQKNLVYQGIKDGRLQLLVGTHTLIQEKIDMSTLALAIVDEQHRFGVEQRKKLLKKAGHTPHMLSMTATPIPRSLALTMYGELDVSILDEKPQNRKPIITKLVSPTDRFKIYARVNQAIELGRQVFVVCPLIESAESVNAKSAEAVFQELSEGPFKNRRIGLLHGKMKHHDKQQVMQQFVAGLIDILVTTTVIEVGVDVPNASIMLLESPERFGLAQIHQLRGRVGRSKHQGYCYVLLEGSAPPSKRLKAIESINDGFKLAELDLQLRGPGALYGTMQHGNLDLRIADLTDIKLISKARQAAKTFIKKGEKVVQYPKLHERVTQLQTVVHLN